jgi:hypothetical protein
MIPAFVAQSSGSAWERSLSSFGIAIHPSLVISAKLDARQSALIDVCSEAENH